MQESWTDTAVTSLFRVGLFLPWAKAMPAASEYCNIAVVCSTLCTIRTCAICNIDAKPIISPTNIDPIQIREYFSVFFRIFSKINQSKTYNLVLF